MLSAPNARPAASYAEALERAAAFAALDDASILPAARTVVLEHGSRAPLAVVLLHGFTNHPGQYGRLAPLVHARGHNVFIPRLPEHGDRDRMTTRLRRLTAERLLASATEAVDIACGLGERVCVLGISTSGLLCAYFAQYRADVTRAIPVSPAFALLDAPYGVSFLLEKVVLAVPNLFLWWDPRIKQNQRPSTAYPRFPTHALMQCLRIADDLHARSKRAALKAASVHVVTNRFDPAVNNAVTAEIVRNWQRFRPQAATAFEFAGLPKNHDIVDPDNPLARTEVVYPTLLAAIDATLEIRPLIRS
ncbi:MAG TPA: alpha/beta fold hydrolase [Candidatus Baltobacteraceae bacterium]